MRVKIKPRIAINTVFGKMFREKEFFLAATDPELLIYKSIKNKHPQEILFMFNWMPEYLHANSPQGEGSTPGHQVEIYLKRGNDLKTLHSLVISHKYPHVGTPGEEYADLFKADPLLHNDFLTQEDLECRLKQQFAAFVAYGLTFLEDIA